MKLSRCVLLTIAGLALSPVAAVAQELDYGAGISMPLGGNEDDGFSETPIVAVGVPVISIPPLDVDSLSSLITPMPAQASVSDSSTTALLLAMPVGAILIVRKRLFV
jgi:hypothetical protein